MANKKFKYDFALSFAGVQRDLARKLYDALNKRGLKVFFDEIYEHVILGRDGTKYFREVYGKESHYCIVLISKEYDKGYWTKIELGIIEARQLESGADILIPVYTDNYRPEWLPSTRIHFDLTKRNFEKLVEILEKKAETYQKKVQSHKNKKSSSTTKPSKKKTINCDDYNWDQLLRMIKNQLVIPVIGHGLYSIDMGGKNLLLYDFLTQKVADQCGIKYNPNMRYGFANVCTEFLKRNKDNYRQLERVLTEFLGEVSMPLNNSLSKLASIEYFNIFLTTAYDNLLFNIIKKVRKSKVVLLSYTSNQIKLGFLKNEIYDNIRSSHTLLVYHMLGNLKKNITPAYTLKDIRETILKFLKDMNGDFQYKNNLFRELKNKCLLFLGFKPEDLMLQSFILPFVDWLYDSNQETSTRLFIGGIWGNNDEKPFSGLLDGLKGNGVEVFDFIESEDFVNCLYNKLKQYPEKK